MKKSEFIGVILFTICFLTGCKGHKQEVYYENLNDTAKLNDNILQLLEKENSENRAKLYVTDTDGVYEYLLYYTQNKGKNLYQTITVKPYMKNDILKLDIEVTNAVNESNVNDEIFNYMILQKEPSQIEISVNGKTIDYGSVESVDAILR